MPSEVVVLRELGNFDSCCEMTMHVPGKGGGRFHMFDYACSRPGGWEV